MVINYYYNKSRPHERQNAEIFKQFVARHQDVVFSQPSPAGNPWHIQAIINGHVLNFWPHKLKGNIEGRRAKVGLNNLDNLVLTVQSWPEAGSGKVIDDDFLQE